jgi:hypothetical protein
MIPSKDARWKVAAHVPTVKIPMEMPHPYDRVQARDLERRGVRLPIYGGHIEVTEANVSAEAALRDGNAAVEAYTRRDPMGNHAQVVAIIEWEDEGGICSAAVQRYHSDS